MQSTITSTSIFDQIGVFIAVPILAIIAWNLWITYVQTLFIKGLKWTLIEIKPPKEISKTPLAMELVLNALYAGGQGDGWYAKYWKGEVSLHSSLEIVSIEGSVRFFIRTPEKFKKIIETQIYSQYPQAEIFEAEDYSTKVPSYTKDGPINLWGCNLVLTKDDPYPIRTYVDYGLDKAVKPEEQQQIIDPITPLIEFFGSIGIGEQLWMQILIRPDTKRFAIKNKEGKEENKGWVDKAKEVVKKLKDELKEKDAEGKVVPGSFNSKAQIAVIDAIERSTTKLGFDTGIRMIYLANKENFNPNNIGGLTGSIRQYNSPELNGFKPDGATSIKYPWEDLFGNKIVDKKSSILSAYKSRKYFYGGTSFNFFKLGSYFTYPTKESKKPFILNTEELATIFHLPGRVSETPTFSRIEAKKAEPPVNLPI